MLGIKVQMLPVTMPPPTFLQADLGSDLAARVPERALGEALGDTAVCVDASLERTIERFSISLKVLGTGLDKVDEAERDGLGV